MTFGVRTTQTRTAFLQVVLQVFEQWLVWSFENNQWWRGLLDGLDHNQKLEQMYSYVVSSGFPIFPSIKRLFSVICLCLSTEIYKHYSFYTSSGCRCHLQTAQVATSSNELAFFGTCTKLAMGSRRTEFGEIQNEIAMRSILLESCLVYRVLE